MQKVFGLAKCSLLIVKFLDLNVYFIISFPSFTAEVCSLQKTNGSQSFETEKFIKSKIAVI